MFRIGVWLAFSFLALARPAAALEPRTYRSASGEYELFIDPTLRDGAGPGFARLRRGDEILWERTLAFTLCEAVVTDGGVAVGYAFTEGRRPTGDFVVAVIDHRGVIKGEHSTPRSWSRFLHFPPNPNPLGIVHDPRSEVIAVRVADEDVNRGVESWWLYSAATGEKNGELRPAEHLPVPEHAPRRIEEVRPLAGLGLILVRWRTVGVPRPGSLEIGAEFTLMNESGQAVWSLALPRDYTAADDAVQAAIEQRVEKHGALLAAEADGSFAIWCVADGERADFRVERDGDSPSGWRIAAAGRRAFAPPEPEPPPPPPPELQLERLGEVALEREAPAAALFRELCQWRVGSDGSIEAIDRVGPRAFAAKRFAADGAPASERALEPFPGEGRADVRWADAGERGWLAALRADDAPLRFFQVDPESGALLEIAAADDWTIRRTVPSVDALAACEDGGFVALLRHWFQFTGTQTLVGFDAEGATRFFVSEDYEDPTRLFGPTDAAVLANGVVAVVETVPGRLKLFSPEGEFLRALELGASFGRKPNYASGVRPGPDGDLLILDFHGEPPLFRLRQDGSVVERVTPRHADGSAPDALAQNARIGADGGLWTADDRAFYRIGSGGIVESAFGSPPSGERLDDVAAAVFDGFGRVLIRDARSGAVHAYGLDGVRQSIVASDLPQHRYGGSERRIAGWEDGELLIWSESRKVHVRCDAAGRELGELALDAVLVPARDGEHLWSLGPGDDLELRARDGTLKTSIPRRADGRWLSIPSAAVGDADGGLLAFAQAGLIPIDAAGRVLAEIPLPGASFYRPEIAATADWVAISEGRGQVLLMARRTGALHRWRPEAADTDAKWSFGFSPDGAELLALRWSDLVLERYALPR